MDRSALSPSSISLTIIYAAIYLDVVYLRAMAMWS